MDQAKPGLIKSHCAPNALSTFLEYMMDYGTPETGKQGEALISEMVAGMEENEQKTAEELLALVRQNRRDVFV